MQQRWSAIGGGFAFLAVALGAFAAHGLESRLTPHLLEVFRTGAYYQMIHALAIVMIGRRVRQANPCRLLVTSLILFTVGIMVFSGSLYLLAVTGQRALGAITPLGGLCFLAGWACFTWSELDPTRSGGD